MAQIVATDPGSSEARSPLIAGLSEGLTKISSILNMQTGNLEDYELTNVYITDKDKNRIYQAQSGYRLWLSDPAPIFKKNGEVITQTNDDFEIDYVGGSIAFSKTSPLQDTDTVTVSCSYINSNSKTIYDITVALEGVTQHAAMYKGSYANVAALATAYPTASDGDYAIVLDAKPAVYVWASTEWKNTQSIEDLSNFYTKGEVDTKLDGKEPTISVKGTTAADDDYYWGGRKTWQDFKAKVRATALTGLSTATNAVISATDTVLAALGKLQAQVSDVAGRSALTGTSNPTTSTVGSIGQRYINTSNGRWWTLSSISGDTYNWTEYVPETRKVAGKALSSDITLAKGDVGLGNVDNTADANKSVASAAKLTTARTITTDLGSTTAGSFNGTANVSAGVTGTLPIANGGTGNTTGTAKYLTVNALAANTDLNNVTTAGFYSCAMTSTAETISNKPSGQNVAFGLIVYSADGAVQIYTRYDNAITFIRRFYLNNWSAWTQFYTAAHPQPEVANAQTAANAILAATATRALVAESWSQSAKQFTLTPNGKYAQNPGSARILKLGDHLYYFYFYWQANSSIFPNGTVFEASKDYYLVEDLDFNPGLLGFYFSNTCKYTQGASGDLSVDMYTGTMGRLNQSKQFIPQMGGLAAIKEICLSATIIV